MLLVKLHLRTDGFALESSLSAKQIIACMSAGIPAYVFYETDDSEYMGVFQSIFQYKFYDETEWDESRWEFETNDYTLIASDPDSVISASILS